MCLYNTVIILVQVESITKARQVILLQILLVVVIIITIIIIIIIIATTATRYNSFYCIQ
jgi:hypothetical protein